MSQIKVLTIPERMKPVALIAGDDSVWLAFASPWWDLATWVWWWFCPSDK